MGPCNAIIFILPDWAGGCSGKASDLHVGSARFLLPAGHRLLWLLYLWLFSVRLENWYVELRLNHSYLFPNLFQFTLPQLFCCWRLTVRDTDSVLEETTGSIPLYFVCNDNNVDDSKSSTKQPLPPLPAHVSRLSILEFVNLVYYGR